MVRYMPNGRPCSPYERELLTILAEEAAEVVQAAMKIARFGVGDVHPDHPQGNCAALGQELGDMQEVISRLIARGIVNPHMIRDGVARKKRHLAEFMQHPED